MENAMLNEAQAEIKNSGRNINNLKYVDDTTLMEESKEKLKSLLMKVKVTWQPTPAFLPGESQGRRSLVVCRLWGRTESYRTDAT